MSITKALAEIQQSLKAAKGQTNSFGGYQYRSCEDILEAVKPLLGEHVVTITDDMQEVGGRVYVKATATFNDGKAFITVSAFAREALNKKGMDEAQITGAASSYARKYALNGLFLIDDNKDPDTQDGSKVLDAHGQKLEAMNQAYKFNKKSIDSVKESLANGEFESAAEAMAELDQEVRLALNVAPTKGGIWTLEETKLFSSPEYAAARTKYFEDKK